MTERLILSGFESHLKSKILNFLFFPKYLLVDILRQLMDKSVLVKQRFLLQWFFSIRYTFLWFKRLRKAVHKPLRFGIRLFSINFCLSFKKNS